MRPPRPIVVFSRDELQRSEWSFAISHHSPSKAGVYYSVEVTGDITLLNHLLAVAVVPPRTLILCAANLADAKALLARIPHRPPTIVVTANRIEAECPRLPAGVSATHERWVVFERLDFISQLKRGPRSRKGWQAADQQPMQPAAAAPA